MDKANKTKTYCIVMIFILIILISGYTVVDKIITKEKQLHNTESNNINSVLKDSSTVIELSLDNKQVNKLYTYMNDKEIEYFLYLNKDRNLDWNTTSLITIKNIEHHLEEDTEIMHIESLTFENKYKEIFGISPSELSIEQRTANICGGASYDPENDVYSVNLNCKNDIKMVSFYKNIVLDNGNIVINKYYAFMDSIFDIEGEYSLYRSELFDEDNLLAIDIKYQDINRYISNMDLVSYYYKQSKEGNYYLDKVVRGG